MTVIIVLIYFMFMSGILRCGAWAFFDRRVLGGLQKAKRTRRYLLGHRRILKKGRLYHTLRKSIFSKGKRRLDFISNRR